MKFTIKLHKTERSCRLQKNVFLLLVLNYSDQDQGHFCYDLIHPHYQSNILKSYTLIHSNDLSASVHVDLFRHNHVCKLIFSASVSFDQPRHAGSERRTEGGEKQTSCTAGQWGMLWILHAFVFYVFLLLPQEQNTEAVVPKIMTAVSLIIKNMYFPTQEEVQSLKMKH